MSITPALDHLSPVLPLIREWCTVCDRYSAHYNGADRVPSTTFGNPPTKVTAIQCSHCGWVTRMP